MAELTPEAAKVLPSHEPEGDLQGVPTEDLYAIARLLKPATARHALHRVLTALNEQGEYFETIAEHIGTSRASASRWAQPPVSTDKRGRRPQPVVDEPGSANG
ncbi:hypothetical protein [Pseudonocardia sp. TRM90224]|uniref:hypothetical protein n=1 Tax=Pseudonocardia sp. TRM90224 TaxID=2812678 RepID=UPI001E338587|nr:hypothetical protein [Pseudonocardia sp. TRM90224]